MSSQISKQPLAGFRVIMGHTQYMTYSRNRYNHGSVSQRWGKSGAIHERILSWSWFAVWTTFLLHSSSKQSTNRRTNLHSPSSCAAVKAACNPLSSITEQLLFGSHIVPTSATPRVSQLFWPQMSCNRKAQRKHSNWSRANVWKRCCS